MKKVSFKSVLILFLLAAIFLSGSMTLKSNYRQKMKDEIKVEITAVGLYDRMQKSVEFIETSTGEVAQMQNDGIRLIGDSTVYSVLNRYSLNFNRGDSVYIVNQLALTYIPTPDQIRHELPPTELTVNIFFGLTAVLWIWFTTALALLYLQRQKRKKQ